MYAMATPYSFFHLMIGRSGRMQEAIDEVLAAGEFDIVQTEFTPMGCYKLRTSAVKILDAHNVEYQNHLRMSVHANSLIRRLWYRRETYLLKREETRACRQHDAVLQHPPVIWNFWRNSRRAFRNSSSPTASMHHTLRQPTRLRHRPRSYSRG